MNDRDSILDRLRHALDRLDVEDPEVRVFPSDGYRIMAVVISRTFEGMDEADRQELVWKQIHESLDEDDRVRIEFVYTDAPSERTMTPDPEPGPPQTAR